MGKTKIKKVEEEEVKEVAETPPAEVSEPKQAKKSKKPGKARGRGKKYQEKVQLIDRTQKYSLDEAIKLTQESSYSKFTGTLEAHINTAAKNMRGLTSMPFLSGKKLTILAFGPSTSLRVNKEAPEFEGIIWGDDETIAEIDKGKINFDVLITTPEWMPKLAKVARILGPRSLMPNPKNGTITENLEKTVTELRAGKVEYKTEPNGKVIHLAIGKADQAPEEVAANIKALYNTLGKSRVKKITLSPTMGPGVKVNLSSI